ncbi:MAG: putative hydroxymethylglutaryl-CoA synthase [Promethearchaeota archaeon]|nr:MAG: putative hydroxymethylglutaryl-CoA synthase [Candidatus Lokiarchaeota archaeon]
MSDNKGLFNKTVGIDSISFYAPLNFIDLKELALKRNVNPSKYTKGLLLHEMRFPEVHQDIISLALRAGYYALQKGDIHPQEIDALFIGTETAPATVYAVKSISNILIDYLGLSKNCLTQDINNACAAGTLAIINASALIEQNIINKALIINVDISNYKLNTPSEPTQGSGAVGLVISKNPRVALLSKKFGKVSSHINDFYRLPMEKTAKVFGKYSVKSYLTLQLNAYDDLLNQLSDNGDYDYYVFHAPFSKLPIKFIKQLFYERWLDYKFRIKKSQNKDLSSLIMEQLDNYISNISFNHKDFPTIQSYSDQLQGAENLILLNLLNTIKHKVLPQLRVPAFFGNMYNASLWAQIIYLLENYAHAGDKIYFGSYGSGATCISGLLKVLKPFKTIINRSPHIADFFKEKEKKTIEEYEIIKEEKVHSPYFNLKWYYGKIEEYYTNNTTIQGVTLSFCEKGCVISPIEGVNECPLGHEGQFTIFFPFFAKLISPLRRMNHQNEMELFTMGYVQINQNVEKGTLLEFDLRRKTLFNPQDYNANGLLNWIPSYSRSVLDPKKKAR